MALKYMKFDNVSCEDLGLQLIDDSHVWKPANHKGGLIDVPGGSEPINFSTFVSGQAEYAKGGENEYVKFRVDPTLANKAYTRANIKAIVIDIKRRLHGKSVNMWFSLFPDYTVDAVLSVEDSIFSYWTIVTVKWQRQPIWLMSNGTRTITPVWTQGNFQAAKNVLLGLPHEDLDISKCGWDYEEVTTRPSSPNTQNPDIEKVVMYRIFQHTYTNVFEQVSYVKILETAELTVSAINAGNFGITRVWRVYVTLDADVDLDFGDTAAVIDVSNVSGWPSEDPSDANTKIGNAKYLIELTGKEPGYAGNVGTGTVPASLQTYLTSHYADCKYGDAFFDYTGYKRWVEPDEEPFPGATHGMHDVPARYYLTQEEKPDWWDDRDITELSWRFQLVSSEPSKYIFCDEANASACAFFVEEKYIVAQSSYQCVFYYEKGTSGDNRRLSTSFSSVTDVRDPSIWKGGDYQSETVTASTYAGAISAFMTAINVTEAHELYVHYSEVSDFSTDDYYDGDDIADYCYFGSSGFNYSGYYYWDTTVHGMRPAASGDTFVVGKVYTGKPTQNIIETIHYQTHRQDEWSDTDWPLVSVPAEFASAVGATGDDIGWTGIGEYYRSQAGGGTTACFFATDTWTEHRIYTDSETPLAVPSTLTPTWCAGFFKATYPDYEVDCTDTVDTGYAFCMIAESTHPCVLSKDGRACNVGGGNVFQTDLPMRNGSNTYHVNVPFSEVDDGTGNPLDPSLTVYWKRGDV